MEEDDDNFLDGVIEFGDGRQYKIDSSEPPSQPGLVSPPRERSRSRLEETGPASLRRPTQQHAPPSVPVSKEERFADDFDRSWPRSKNSPPVSARDLVPPARPILVPSTTAVPESPVSSHYPHSPQESSRVLFNERSNRLEPYSNSHRPGQVPYPPKRGSDYSASPTESRSGRDLPPMGQGSSNNVQLLQKPGSSNAGDFSHRPRRLSNSGGGGGYGPGGSSTFHNDRPRDRESYRRDDMPPPSSRLPLQSPRIRDNFNSFVSNSANKDREFTSERGRRSNMGPPPPPHSMRVSSRDNGRQIPPHLSQISPNMTHPPSERRIPSRDSRWPPHSPFPPELSPSFPHSSHSIASQSPVLSQASSVAPGVLNATPDISHLSAPELDEARKDVMQSAAARAKARRQQEEEEREKEKERARRKAAEIEERINAAEAAKARLKSEDEKVRVSRVPYMNLQVTSYSFA